jgi:arginine deiminase
MHLDTVFTMLNPDTVSVCPQVMDKVRAISPRPDASEGPSMSPRRRASCRQWPTP